MPRKFRRFFVSVFLVLVSIYIVSAQTTADVMRERITKAKAYIAVKNYNAAIYELENIRRETNDPTVNSVINILLMNSYVEQGDYKRAQDFLTQLAKPNKPDFAANYLSVAAQVVRGARSQLERYKALGLSVSDRNLPLEAAADIEKMRQTLELVVEQSKVLGKDKTQTSNAMALLEEATNVRSSLAKDDYDASRWKNEAADAREMLANSRSVVMNADGTTNPTETMNQNTVAANTSTATTTSATTTQTTNNTNLTLNPVSAQTVSTANNQTANPQTDNPAVNKETATTTEKPNTNTPTNITNTDSTTAGNQTRTRRAENNNPQTTTDTQATTENNTPLAVGSLIDYATQKVNPTYPQQARTIRQTGIVRVELTIDEQGKVVEVQKTSGPSLLQTAAKDAARKWRFKPFMRDGQPVKATGFISFDFNL